MTTLRCGAILGLRPLHPWHQQIVLWGKTVTCCPCCTPRLYARHLAKHRNIA